MRSCVLALALLVGAVAPARAQDMELPPPQVIRRSGPGTGSGAAHPAAVVQEPAASMARGAEPSWEPPPAQPSQREIERSVRAYLGDARPLIEPRSAGSGVGYDGGFMLRGAGFSLRANLALQARFESFAWQGASPAPGGDRSGFSLPRAVLRLAGELPYSTHYLLELDVGSHGSARAWEVLQGCNACTVSNLGPDTQTAAFSPLREAWVERALGSVLSARVGLLPTPATRQLMVPASEQQFVDVSLASAWTGLGMPGYTDRNRDVGLLLHGVLGKDRPLAWRACVTSGAGAGARGLRPARGASDLAFSARLDWAFLAPIGFQEGALRQLTQHAYGELGAWAFYQEDRFDAPSPRRGDYLRFGIDVALGYGGWSFGGALTWTEDRDIGGVHDDSGMAWLLQLGHHRVGGPWEIAARWSGYRTRGDLTGDGQAQEFAAVINYYLNGHGNKLQLDFAWIDTDAGGFLVLDPYAAYPAFLRGGDAGCLLRFQWQLAL